MTTRRRDPGLVIGLTGALREFERLMQRAAFTLVDRGLALIDEGRTEPTDPLEIIAVEAARLQALITSMRGIPPYMRGSKTRAAQLAAQASREIGR